MFAKVFTQILESSLAEDYQTRHVFEDLLKLCDMNGVVDVTPEAIARRTNVPLEIVLRGITELEKPDPRSRTPDHDGKRIVRLSDHRDWGWAIVNYDIYRGMETEEQRREKGRLRVQKLRERRRQPDLPKVETGNAPVTPGNAGNAPVTPGNAGNAMERERERKMDFDKASSAESNLGPNTPGYQPTKPAKAKKFSRAQKEIVDRFEAVLGIEWENDRSKWLGRIAQTVGKAERVIADVENAAKEGRINVTRAGYAEDTWKRFA